MLAVGVYSVFSHKPSQLYKGSIDPNVTDEETVFKVNLLNMTAGTQ